MSVCEIVFETDCCDDGCLALFAFSTETEPITVFVSGFFNFLANASEASACSK